MLVGKVRTGTEAEYIVIYKGFGVEVFLGQVFCRSELHGFSIKKYDM